MCKQFWTILISVQLGLACKENQIVCGTVSNHRMILRCLYNFKTFETLNSFGPTVCRVQPHSTHIQTLLMYIPR